MNKPNLLFVFADQLRKYDLGCYGSRQCHTPHIDRLAARGLRFNHCQSNSPLCVPARGSMLTAQFAQVHKAFTNDMAIRYDLPSIADLLNAGGWHTGYIGKWHLCGIPRDQFIDKDRRLGFTEWKVANCNHNYMRVYYDDERDVRHFASGYEPEVFGGLADEFVRRNAGAPWALYLSFATPHNPHEILPDDALAPYRDKEIELPPNVPESGIKWLPNHDSTRAEQAADARGYFAHITAIDKQVGKLLDALTETGQLDNTLIVFTADHGELQGSHALTDKQTAHAESVDVPLVAAHPTLVREGVTDELIGLVDLPTTLAGALGLSFPGHTDGRDLSPLLCDPEAKGLDEVYLYDLYPVHNAYAKGLTAWRALRTDRYTYCINEKEDLYLYDNFEDPYQLRDLKDDPAHAEIKAELRARLMKQIEAHDALVSGDDYVRMSGQIEEFNRSQVHFHYPPVSEK